MKSLIIFSKFLSIAIVVFFSAIGSALADGAKSMAYFGVGLEQIKYSEKYDAYSTDVTSTNTIQRSGSYVAVDDRWGFYIDTESALLTNHAEEQWSYDSIGVIQENKFSAERQILDVLGGYRLGLFQSLLMGVHYQKVLFNRYDFRRGNESAVFEQQYDAELDISEKYVVGESSTSFSGSVGYLYNEFFENNQRAVKWRCRLLFSLPLYTETLNTSASDLSFKKSFSGYDVNGELGLGREITPHVIVAANIGLGYSVRDEVKQGGVILPENRFLATQGSITAHWSF